MVDRPGGKKARHANALRKESQKATSFNCIKWSERHQPNKIDNKHDRQKSVSLVQSPPARVCFFHLDSVHVRMTFSVSKLPRFVKPFRNEGISHRLISSPDSGWLKANRGNKPITERWLANRLRRFGIASQTLRVEDRQAKGYALADFRAIAKRSEC